MLLVSLGVVMVHHHEAGPAKVHELTLYPGNRHPQLEP